MTTEQMDAVDAMKGVGNFTTTYGPSRTVEEHLASLRSRRADLQKAIEVAKSKRLNANEVIRFSRAELAQVDRMIRAAEPRRAPGA